MIWLLVIADDLTGALDTGVQFTNQGIAAKVGTVQEMDVWHDDGNTKVLVLDAETRHKTPKEAYSQVKQIVLWAKGKEIPWIYKKTDSVLRGNIGSELTAVLENVKSRHLYFIPAYPEMKRYTIDGIQYLDGRPLAQTEQDVFDPVTDSYIPKIIEQQSACQTVVLNAGEKIPEDDAEDAGKTIYVCDARTEEEIEERLKDLEAAGELSIMAGCAGFAGHLAKLLKEKLGSFSDIRKPRGMLIACGSLNKVTKNQLEYLEKKGVLRLHLMEELKKYGQEEEKGEERLAKKLGEIISRRKMVILDTFDDEESTEFEPEKRSAVADCHGRIARVLMEEQYIDYILATGGDTLMGIMKAAEFFSMTPLCELEKGVVLSDFSYSGTDIRVISKSGGFGEEELLYDVLKKMNLLRRGE